MNNYFFTWQRRSNGFTLIELVITLAILMVVAVIVIPSVRTLNKDRKVHDTARVVGSVFAAAREQAAVDGSAGVEISSLPNSVVPNMGMVLYQVRAIPPYNGDTVDHVARITTFTPAVNETTPGNATVNFSTALSILVGRGDSIEFGHAGILYEIDNLAPVTQDITILLPFFVPAPPASPAGIDLPFKIHRQPIRVESSVVRMPRNLFLNFSWSGHGIDGNQFAAGTGPVRVWFNKDGSIDQATLDRNSGTMERVDGPLYLLMCTGEGDEVDVTITGAQRFIEDDNNLWIVVDNRNGGVTLGAMAELGTAIALDEKITASRLLAKNRRSTTP